MLNSRQVFQPSKKENVVSSSATSNTYYKIRTIQKLQNNSASSVSVNDPHAVNFMKQQLSQELP